MKPLVNYCRWQKAKLRLQGRDDDSVWGQLAFRTADGQNTVRNFNYHLGNAELTIDDDNGQQRILLDEMGVPLPENDLIN